jgi:hypothetical protein
MVAGNRPFLANGERLNPRLIRILTPPPGGAGFPDAGSPGNGTRRPIALTRYDPATRTFRFVLDADTANAAIHVINALDREAHAREVQLNSHYLPEDTYGRRNREGIALREPKPPPASSRSNAPTEHPSTTTPHQHPSPPRSAQPLTERGIRSWNWDETFAARVTPTHKQVLRP